MIKRYSLAFELDYEGNNNIGADPFGNLVEYADHLAELSKVQSLNADYLYSIKCGNAENMRLNDELSSLRLKLEAAEKDVQRMNWIIDNYTGNGGGNGFEVRVWIPVDTECVRHGIDEALRTLHKDGK